MEIDWYFRLLFLFVLLLFSGFFSGSEVALFSLDQKKIKELKKEHKFVGNYVSILIEFPRRLLVTILIGNTLVNVGASILSVTLILEMAKSFVWNIEIALLIQIVLLTVLILIFGEITPKVWAAKYPIQFARIVAIPLYWVSILVYPISKTLTDIIKYFVSKLKIDKSSTAMLSSEFTELASLGVEKGTIEEDEQELIDGIVSFKTVTVREVMTPRVDLTAISTETTFDELIIQITESGHSRIPLYENNMDTIIGVIYAKDLLPYLSDSNLKNTISLREIARKVMYIPESKLISDLMHEFQNKNMHMGIVVDEYGGTAGLVSLEDILEEIVGEIRDEYDKEENPITKLSDNSYYVLGKVPIDELNELLDVDLSSENDDYDTIAGFIFTQAGSIPEVGFSFKFDNVTFIVKEVENNRINKILIEKLAEKQNDG
ncbi:MAG: hemolysin family protein [bacterium]